MLGTAVTLAGVGYSSDLQSAIVLLTLSVSAGSMTRSSGYNVNHLDIAPQYAAVLYGITNTAGTSTGFIGAHVAFSIVTAKDVSLCYTW